MKNIKRLGNFLVILLLCAGLFAPAISVVTAYGATTSQTTSASGVFDEADLLTTEEEQKLSSQITEYVEKYDADIAIVTTNNAGGKESVEYADAYAEKLGMAMNSDGHAGILFLMDMDNRQIYISTSGQAIGWYSSSRIDAILEDCYQQIIGGNYYDCGTAFLKGVRDYMGVEPGKSARMSLLGVLIRLLIALVVGGGITFSMVYTRGGRITTSGRTYLDAGHTKMEVEQDLFVNRTVTRRHIPKPENKSGGGGGGGMHMSSGGGAHGGGGKSF